MKPAKLTMPQSRTYARQYCSKVKDIYTCGGVDESYRRRSPLLVSFRCADHRPIRIRDERERLVTASPVMTKCRGPSWGRNNYPENGLVKPPCKQWPFTCRRPCGDAALS